MDVAGFGSAGCAIRSRITTVTKLFVRGTLEERVRDRDIEVQSQNDLDALFKAAGSRLRDYTSSMLMAGTGTQVSRSLLLRCSDMPERARDIADIDQASAPFIVYEDIGEDLVNICNEYFADAVTPPGNNVTFRSWVQASVVFVNKVQELARMGIEHGDIKLENAAVVYETKDLGGGLVLVDPVIRLLDFGQGCRSVWAKLVDDTHFSFNNSIPVASAMRIIREVFQAGLMEPVLENAAHVVKRYKDLNPGPEPLADIVKALVLQYKNPAQYVEALDLIVYLLTENTSVTAEAAKDLLSQGHVAVREMCLRMTHGVNGAPLCAPIINTVISYIYALDPTGADIDAPVLLVYIILKMLFQLHLATHALSKVDAAKRIAEILNVQYIDFLHRNGDAFNATVSVFAMLQSVARSPAGMDETKDRLRYLNSIFTTAIQPWMACVPGDKEPAGISLLLASAR